MKRCLTPNVLESAVSNKIARNGRSRSNCTNTCPMLGQNPKVIQQPNEQELTYQWKQQDGLRLSSRARVAYRPNLPKPTPLPPDARPENERTPARKTTTTTLRTHPSTFQRPNPTPIALSPPVPQTHLIRKCQNPGEASGKLTRKVVLGTPPFQSLLTSQEHTQPWARRLPKLEKTP